MRLLTVTLVAAAICLCLGALPARAIPVPAALFLLIPTALLLTAGLMLRSLRNAVANLARLVETLQQRCGRYEGILRCGTEGFWELEIATGAVYFTPRWKQILGYEDHELENRIEAWESRLHPEDYARAVAPVRDGFEGCLPHHEIEYRLRHRDGTYRWYLSRLQMQRDSTGKPLSITGSLTEITEQRQAEEKQARLRLLSLVAEHSNSGVFITDTHERILFVNPALCRISGYTPSEMLGLRPSEVLQGPMTDLTGGPRLRAAVQAKESLREEIISYRKDGKPYWIELCLTPVRATSENVTHFIGIANDITDRKYIEEELRESRHFSQRIADSLPYILYIYDLVEKRNVYVNRQIGEVLGYGSEELQAMGAAILSSLVHPEDLSAVEAHHQKLLKAPDSAPQTTECRLRHKNGDWRWLSSRSTVFTRTNDGQATQILGTAQDITERKRIDLKVDEQMLLIAEINVELEFQKAELEESNLRLEDANARLEALSVTDGLTGLKNHRAFQEHLEQEFGRARRYNTSLSLILLDVDRFKQYNDTFGHPAGDEVLKTVAFLLQETARASDFVARYGGEEFVIILPGTSRFEAIEAGNRFRRGIEEADWTQRPMTASFGVATLTAATADRAQLIAEADRALYASKQNGRNCVTHHADLLPSPVTTETPVPF